MTVNLYVIRFPSRVILLEECSVSLAGGNIGALAAIVDFQSKRKRLCIFCKWNWKDGQHTQDANADDLRRSGWQAPRRSQEALCMIARTDRQDIHNSTISRLCKSSMEGGFCGVSTEAGWFYSLTRGKERKERNDTEQKGKRDGNFRWKMNPWQ